MCIRDSSLHCWGRLNCTTSWSKNVSGLMLLTNPGTNTVFHNTGFLWHYSAHYIHLNRLEEWTLSECMLCKWLNMIYVLIHYTSVHYQETNTTTAGNYSSLNSWVDTIYFYYILCVDISVIKPWIKMIPVMWYDIISLVKWHHITSRVWIVQSNRL